MSDKASGNNSGPVSKRAPQSAPVGKKRKTVKC